MIYSINIKNIALISEADINFSNGFNVITGETGAGKSVLIGSINMLLGERISKDTITTGKRSAEVSAVFYVEDKLVKKHLEDMGIRMDETGELVMSRELFADGRNVCRINSKIVNVATLKDIGRYLVDLHGQHNNQALLDHNAHIHILDKFAKDKIEKVYAEYSEHFLKLCSLKNELCEIEKSIAEKERRIDILNFEINEIKSVNPEIGEDDELKKKKEIIDNFKNLCSSLGKAHYLLYDDPEGNSAYQSMSNCADLLKDAEKIDGTLKETADIADGIAVQIQEIARTLSSYLDNLENEVEPSFDVDARIDELYKLKRKYGGNLESVLEYLEKSEEELELINNYDAHYNKVSEELNKERKAAQKLAVMLSEIRKETAKKIESEICDSLHFLNMNDAVFSVSFEETELSKTGCDKVEFMLTTIKDAPPRPLTKIASGGELSRIMLAIKSVLAETDSVNTMIFDEIDTGVSGIAAQKIGEKIKELSKNKQIFCVTHLAQIASKAETHFKIEKISDGNKTKAYVQRLDDEGRINEIARIISGDKITSTTIKQAGEMLDA
ncbi:MAG: DNA repair protein RecN [Ruminococcaceae bacterium]|nr:DNA repair protein RecN [Oscillospiraceae bacterium]